MRYIILITLKELARTLRSEAHVIPATIVKLNKANKQNKLNFKKYNFSTAVQRSDKLKHSEFIPAFSLN